MPPHRGCQCLRRGPTWKPLVAATDILSVAIASLPSLAAGDSFAIGAGLLSVTFAERDASGTVRRVPCQR